MQSTASRAVRRFGCTLLLLIWSVTAAVAAEPALVAKGRYLAAAANCQSCHTREGGAPYAGGVAFDTPFGTLYSSNITPDRQTGLGDWSADDFTRALHEGIGRHGEQLYPAFPYVNYTHMSRADITAIRAYLQSVAAVRYTPPANALRFPFNYRPLIRFWKWVNFSPGDLDAPAPAADGSARRGQYLVDTLGHCGQCHTPRTLTYGLDADHKFAGAKQGGWYAWNITNGDDGIGAWPDAALAAYLANGHTHDARMAAVAAGPMAEVVTDSTRWLTADDRRAMVAYLREVSAQSTDSGHTPAPPPAGAAAPGNTLYAQHCASCHAAGAPGGAATQFAHESAVTGADPDNLIRVLLEGISRTGADGRVFMPAYAHQLSDAQIASIVNTVRARFANRPAEVSADDVAALRETGAQ